MAKHMIRPRTLPADRGAAAQSGGQDAARHPSVEEDGDGLREILALLSADSADPSCRRRQVEDRIRQHWTVLCRLVREHRELTLSTAEPSAGRRRADPLGLHRRIP